MRPPKTHQSAIATPLNRILGAEANVRILRVLALDLEPLTRSELARRAALEVKGAHSAAKRLEELGILIRVGSGSRQQVKLNLNHPLAAPLQALFQAENAREQRIIGQIQRAIHSFGSEIDSGWFQGSFATARDLPGEPIEVGILAKGRVLQHAHSAIRETLSSIEDQEDIAIELRGYTRADLEVATPDELHELAIAKPIWGPPPSVYLSIGKNLAHARNLVAHTHRDAELVILAKEIAGRLARNPEKRKIAIDWLQNRLQAASARERSELEEWLRILRSASPSRLARLLTDQGERATRLRQSLPFARLLSEQERNAILKKAREP